MPHLIKACAECSQPYICFMIKRALWNSFFSRYDCTRICLPCFEKHLGREITVDDLMTREEIFEVATHCNDFWREALRPL